MISLYSLVLLLALTLSAVCAEEKLRLCVREDSWCIELERDGLVRCKVVKNTAECAIKIAAGKADFGIFTADDLLVSNHFYPKGLQVIVELKRNPLEQFKYQSVVVVSKNYTASENKFNLAGGGYCHPGFSRYEKWHDRALKYFEKKVVPHTCGNVGNSENEIINLKNYFGKACRPGDWVPNPKLDEELKKKYPEMCKSCGEEINGKIKCEYSNKNNYGHAGALDCLKSGRGKVAYVSLQHARNYTWSHLSSDYRFLCEDGSVMPLESADPCTWYKEPWDVIVTREESASEVLDKLEQVIGMSDTVADWKKTIKKMLFEHVSPILYKNYTTPKQYLSKASNMEMLENLTNCDRSVRWCTVNDQELTKCNWTSAVSQSLGLTPKIDCMPAKNSFDCLKKIMNNESDIISIDSNYGHLARKVYKLSPVMYCATREKLNSFVVAVVRDKPSHSMKIKTWSDVKNSKACFPEYGGIAWLSFLNIVRDNGLVSNSCKYSEIMAKFLDAACTPGFMEASHSVNLMTPRLAENDLDKLCKLCPRHGEHCEASPANAYFGDKGALDCLKGEPNGLSNDIAFVEVVNLKAFLNSTINQTEYRVLCRNGSLAEHTGFRVDDACALSVTIDSEVVSRRVDEKSREYQHLVEIQLLLLKLQEWLGYRAGDPRNTMHIFGPFNGTEDLLFKDSVVYLEHPTSDIQSVQNYKELFSHVDKCSGGLKIFAVLSLVAVNFLFARFM